MIDTPEEAFELMFQTAELRRSSATHLVSGTLTFHASVPNVEIWDRMVGLAKKPGGLKFYIYGSFEDEVVNVLKDERNRWRKEAEIAKQRVAALENQLRELQNKQ